MVVDFNKEMFFQLSCFWPPEEVKRFAEAHDLITEVDEKRSRSVGKRPEQPRKNGTEAEGILKQSTEQILFSGNAPPKAPRSADIGPAKPTRGIAQEPPKETRNLNEGLHRSNRVLSKKMPKKTTLIDVAKGKNHDNPFEEDSLGANNPFLDDDNPFEEKEPLNPFVDDEPKNPVADDEPKNPFEDENDSVEESGNPFLD